MGNFLPSTVSFIYERYANNYPSETVTYNPSPNEDPIVVDSKPEWVDAILSGNSGGGNPEYIIRIDSSKANALSEGFHSGTIQFKTDSQGGQGLPTVGMSISVTLNVIANQHLYVTPTSFTQAYVMGGPLPGAKFVNIKTPNNWSITAQESWIGFNKDSGTGDDVVSIFANPTGLSAGTYTSNILIDDGQNQEVVTFVFNISGSVSEEEYLSVSRDFLNYSQNKNTTTGFERNVVVDASDPVTITADQYWVDLSDTAFTAGTNTLTVGIKDADNVPIGVHHATIDVSTPFFDEQIDVYLTVVRNTISGIKSDTLYFAHDRNEIYLTNAQDNQEALFKFSVNANQGNERFKKIVPYFQNKMDVIIGLRNEVFTSFAQLTSNLSSFFNGPPSTRFIDPVEPTKWRVDVYDKGIGNSLTQQRLGLNDVHFVNGRNPLDALQDRFEKSEIEFLENYSTGPEIAELLQVKYAIHKPKIKNIFLRLTYLPTQIVLPVDAVLALSYYFYSFAFPGGRIVEISGAVEDTIQGNPMQSNTDFYSCLVALKQYGFKKGDRITVEAGVIKTKVTFVEPRLPTTQIIWTNEWGFPEVYNATGEIRVRAGADQETDVLSQDGRNYEQIISAKTEMEYEVDLGKIYYQDQIDFVQTLFNAEKVWLNIQGSLVEVIPDSRNMDLFNTREFEKERKLSFKSALV